MNAKGLRRIFLGVLLALACEAQAQFSFTTNNGALTVANYSGPSGAVTIPARTNGMPVVAIAGYGISSYGSILNLTIPGSITNIGDYAFQFDYNLPNLYFVGNAPSVGPHAFFSDGFYGVIPVAHYLSGTTGWGAPLGAGVATVQLPGIVITASPTNSPAGSMVSFTATNIDSGGNTVTNWNWDFGDGSTSTAQNPSHAYATSGAFWVALFERSNALSVAGAAVSITVNPLAVGCTASPTNGLEPLTVNFTSASADSGGNAISTWNWNFGDGTSSAAQNPSHTYSNSGTFSVTLSATNNLGIPIAGMVPSITVSPLTVTFGATPTTGLVPLLVNFSAPAVDNVGHAITGWRWDFSDGSISTAQNPSHTYTTNGIFTPTLIATNSLGLMVLGLGPGSVNALLPVPHYTNFNVVHTFAGSDGANPYAGLTLSGNTLYGTTESSVAPISGTVFRFNDATLTFTDLLHFPNLNPPGIENYDGANPEASVVQSGNTLYGTAVNGAQAGYGDVFSLDTTTLKVVALHAFSTPTHNTNTTLYYNSDGISPQSAPVLAGTLLYGTTAYGGTNGYGTVFSFNTANSNFTTLHTFTGAADGAFPVGDLLLSGNTLYGTANSGGSNGYGAVFSLSTSGSNFTALHGFNGGIDGAYPQQGALLLSGSTLYGTTAFGGSNAVAPNGWGTIFSLGANGSNFRSLYSFTGGDDGAYPCPGLILSGGKLYGATFGGGPANNGTLYSLGLAPPAIAPTTLYSFTATTGTNQTNLDGANPNPGLVLTENVLYGTARYGGTNGYGTVFAFPLPGSPAVPITLITRLSAGKLILSWNDPSSAFSLQSSPSATGGFTDVLSASSPYTNIITGASQFYRLIANGP